MKQKALITNGDSIWLEEFDVEKKHNRIEVETVVKFFNDTLKVGEKKRKLHSMPIRSHKVIYFADPFDPPTDEVERIIIYPLSKKGILFDKIKCTEIPPFDEIYDILFFDWGGMSMGNSLLESFCDEIIKESIDYPNRMYVMTSTFTLQAMEDALATYGDKLQKHNIFLTIDAFVSNWNAQNQ